MAKYLSRAARALQAQESTESLKEELENLLPKTSDDGQQTLVKIKIPRELCGKFDDIQNEISQLQSEMQEWADNMSGTNLEHTTKYENVSETASEIDSQLSYLNNCDLDPEKEYDISEIESIIDNLDSLDMGGLSFPGMYE